MANIYDFLRNDVPIVGGTLASFMPCMYGLLILLPFVGLFSDKMFRKSNKKRAIPYNVVHFHVYKNSYNPFKDDVYQVSLLNHDTKHSIVSKSALELAEFIETQPANATTYLVYNGDKAQEVALRNMIKGYVDPYVYEALSFVDIKLLYMYLNQKTATERVTVNEIATALNIQSPSYVQTYYNILKKMDIIEFVSELYVRSHL